MTIEWEKESWKGEKYVPELMNLRLSSERKLEKKNVWWKNVEECLLNAIEFHQLKNLEYKMICEPFAPPFLH